MQETQLTCPHCGSTLNFGTQIAAGTPVECLICMQTFAAKPMPVPAASPVPQTIPAAQPAPPPSSVTPKLPPPLGKPAKASSAKPTAPRLRRPQEASGGGKWALVAVALGLFLLLGGGVTAVVWKLATSGQDSNVTEIDPQFAQDSQKDGGKPGTNVVPPKADPGPKKKQQPDDDEIDFKKIKEAENKLVRKKPAGGALEPEWNPVINIKDQQENYVGLTQKSINLAIEKGVVYLKRSQFPTGTWAQAFPVGHAALGGLTLLECQAPPNDIFVQRAAVFVRAHAPTLEQTYEMALSILFLDRLGNPRDRPLIQGLALRLLAGQTDCGGWSYTNPMLNAQEMYQLYAFLHSNKQPTLLNPLYTPPEKNPAAAENAKLSDKERSKDPFQKFGALVVAKGFDQVAPDPKKPAPKQKAIVPLRPEWLQANLQRIPVVRNQGKRKGKHQVVEAGGDNSNTQFALLALWAARRHDIPSEQAIMAAYQRFVVSQGKDGGWAYTFGRDQQSSDAMTCVGLLGLAMGHGTSPDIVKFDPVNPKNSVVRPALEDPIIRKGLKTLSGYLGEPIVKGNLDELNSHNLYWLWSIERVAMLYDLKTIEGKQWYPWGAQIILHNQTPEGSWANSGFPGSDESVNTCFALLFLRRSNLVQDLTHHLRLFTGIRDSEK